MIPLHHLKSQISLVLIVLVTVISKSNGILAQPNGTVPTTPNPSPTIPASDAVSDGEESDTPETSPPPPVPDEMMLNPPNPSTAPPVVLGQPCDNPYVVAIPTSALGILDRVQTVIPSAFLTTSRLGPYVHAGSSSSRREAAALSQRLRRAGLDARVIYRPVSCESPPQQR